MSLLPFVDLLHPHRILDQHFGHNLLPQEFSSPLNVFRSGLPSSSHHHHNGYLRPWRTALSERDIGSTIAMEKDNFQVNLDVQQFAPNEIHVKVNDKDRTIVIEGRHEEKQDEHGFISRQFVRKYLLPRNYDLNKVTPKLSSDGVLTIVAPSVDEEKEHRDVAITHTGLPVKPTEPAKVQVESQKNEPKEK